MTTSIKIHVNGRYRATVVQTNADGARGAPVIVDGNYEGSPNPSGEHSFHLYHPAVASFSVTEEAVPEDDKPSAA
jgi:hypothetical protein